MRAVVDDRPLLELNGARPDRVSLVSWMIGVSLSALLFARLDIAWTWIAVLSFLAFGALGARDDWKKLTVPGSKGMSERTKLLGQLGLAVARLAKGAHAGSP